MWKEHLENTSLNVRCGSERQRDSDDRVFSDILAFMSFRRCCSSEEYFVMYTLFNFEPVERFK